MSPFDGAVDGIFLEVHVYVATVAGDACVGCPAVYVSAKGSEGSENRYMDGDEVQSAGERRVHCMGRCSPLCGQRGVGIWLVWSSCFVLDGYQRVLGQHHCLAGEESVDGVTPTPSWMPKGKEMEGGGVVDMVVGSGGSV